MYNSIKEMRNIKKLAENEIRIILEKLAEETGAKVEVDIDFEIAQSIDVLKQAFVVNIDLKI